MPKYIFQHLYETAEVWAEKNMVLREGEPGVESDTNKMKYGDGYTRWNQLPYLNAEVPPSAESFYHKHIQNLASAGWLVTHNLGKHPNVGVYINDELHIVPILPIDLNSFSIPFSTPQTGYVICS